MFFFFKTFFSPSNALFVFFNFSKTGSPTHKQHAPSMTTNSITTNSQNHGSKRSEENSKLGSEHGSKDTRRLSDSIFNSSGRNSKDLSVVTPITPSGSEGDAPVQFQQNQQEPEERGRSAARTRVRVSSLTKRRANSPLRSIEEERSVEMTVLPPTPQIYPSSGKPVQE